MGVVDNSLLDRLEKRIDRSGEPPDDGDMEARVKILEESSRDARDRLIRIETRTDSFATKADVANAKNSIIMWVVSAVLLAQLLPTLLKMLGQ